MADAASEWMDPTEIDAHAIAFEAFGESERARVARREERTETNLIAIIRLPNGTEIPCVVKDVSKSGAKLGIPRGCALPAVFMFKMNGRDFIFQVTLAWQRDRYAGVRIDRIAKLPPNLRQG